MSEIELDRRAGDDLRRRVGYELNAVTAIGANRATANVQRRTEESDDTGVAVPRNRIVENSNDG
jgi:hypothetical protein